MFRQFLAPRPESCGSWSRNEGHDDREPYRKGLRIEHEPPAGSHAEGLTVFFNSLSYLLFLLAVLIVFHNLRAHARPSFLLAASIVFYAFVRAPHLLVILALVTAISFVLGIRIESAATDGQRRL